MGDVEKMKTEIWDSFAEQQHIFLATVEGDQPRVRPVTLIYLSNRMYVATGSNDAKTMQIKENPRTEFCLMIEKKGHNGTIRAECQANIVQDMKVKTDIYTKIPFIREFFKTPEDPGYTLIELEPTRFEYMKPGTVESAKIKP